MNLRHLRAFVAIVDCGGYARASAHLNLSQPALSRQIQALEQELGVPFFDRVGRRVELSAEGADLLRHCRDLLAHVDAIEARARDLRVEQTNVLRVGATPNVIGTLLADFLTSYQRRNRGSEVQLVESAGAGLPDILTRGDIHLAILPAEDDRFSAQPLFPIHLVAVCHDGHKLSGRRSIEVADLADEPLLRLSRGFASGRWLEPICETAQVRLRNVFESATPQALIQLARTGYGIAVIPSSIPVPPDGVHVTPIMHGGASIGRWATAAWNSQRPLGVHGRRFVEEFAGSVQYNFPGCELVHGAPPLPQPMISGK